MNVRNVGKSGKSEVEKKKFLGNRKVVENDTGWENFWYFLSPKKKLFLFSPRPPKKNPGTHISKKFFLTSYGFSPSFFCSFYIPFQFHARVCLVSIFFTNKTKMRRACIINVFDA